MAIEPINTSDSYISSEAYTAPVGRLPVLGKARVAIDQIRASVAATFNEMKNKDLRTIAEVALLDQKTATELANVADTIPANMGQYTGAVGGVVKAQKDLYTAQKDGFARDAEQKLAKIVADTWSIQKSMNDVMVPDHAGLAEFQILDVINKARTGVGINPAVPIP
jgi:hypothetical protein